MNPDFAPTLNDIVYDDLQMRSALAEKRAKFFGYYTPPRRHPSASPGGNEDIPSPRSWSGFRRPRTRVRFSW